LRRFVDSVRTDATSPRIFAIDTSKLSLPNCFRDSGVMPRNEAATKPLLMCSTLFDVKYDVPYHSNTLLHHNERRALLETHFSILRSGDLVIGDRGYYSHEVCSKLQSINVDILFRVKDAASSSILNFVRSRRNERIINQNGVGLKCFKYTKEGVRYVLVTSRIHMSLDKARALYTSRWRIEEGFRRWKSDFRLTQHTPRALHALNVDIQCVSLSHALTRVMVDGHAVYSAEFLKHNVWFECMHLPAFKAYATELFVEHALHSQVASVCIEIDVDRVSRRWFSETRR